ncbi:rihA [Symbiodinium microadriaticum]|nr:rihA [Symbiodinium microadriaticum]
MEIASDDKLPLIIDTDANNELDDQHALAYLFFNQDLFDIVGVTVNTTSSGGNIDKQVAEAVRVMKLCDVYESIPMLPGADDSFSKIAPNLEESAYDGHEAVEFIIRESQKKRESKLILLPIGKLTNIALALKKAPEIAQNIRIIWLGSNYPEPGEHNLVNDIPAMNFILDMEVPFEMVMVRYGEPSGSDAVRVTPERIEQEMKGLGPSVDPIVGRHGGIDLHGDPPSRALFDVVPVALLKNKNWGEFKEIPAPTMEDEEWIKRPDNPRMVGIWENFNSPAILNDFFETMRSPSR